MKPRIRLAVSMLISLLAFNLSYAFAYTNAFSLGESRVTVFAPDWIWQGQNVNIMLVVDNKDMIEQKIDVSVSASGDNQKYFDLPEKMANTGTAPAKGKLRLAITGIVPKKSAALGKYQFLIDVKAGSSGRELTYQLEVIRGSLVEAGVWSVLLPALIALVWGVSFCIVLPRFSERGAWKKKRPPFSEYAEKGEWFNE